MMLIKWIEMAGKIVKVTYVLHTLWCNVYYYVYCLHSVLYLWSVVTGLSSVMTSMTTNHRVLYATNGRIDKIFVWSTNYQVCVQTKIVWYILIITGRVAVMMPMMVGDLLSLRMLRFNFYWVGVYFNFCSLV